MPEEGIPIPIQTSYLETLETMAATLRKKAAELEVNLPKDVAFYLAQNVRSNACALELALIRLAVHSSMAGTEITLAWTQKLLQNFIDTRSRKVVVDLLQNPPSQPVGTKEAKGKRQDPTAANRDFVFCLMRAREGKTSRAKRESEVNMRESERERLARRDAYERAMERRAKRRNQA